MFNAMLPLHSFYIILLIMLSFFHTVYFYIIISSRLVEIFL